jgi:hypothetical protein
VRGLGNRHISMRDGIEEVVGRDGATRNETALQRIDRNLVELLQEVRVVQTGVQVLFAFLLTAPLAPASKISPRSNGSRTSRRSSPRARPRFC